MQKYIYILVIFWLTALLSWCQQENIATQISWSGEYTDISESGVPKLDKSENTAAVYIYWYQDYNRDRDSSVIDVYYNDNPIYITNILNNLSGKYIASEWLSISSTWNTAIIKASRTWSISFDSKVNLFIKTDRQDIWLSGGKITINFWPSKLVNYISLIASWQESSLAYNYTPNNRSYMSSFGSIIPPSKTRNAYVNTNSTDTWSDIKAIYMWQYSTNKLTWHITLNEYMKKQGIELTDMESSIFIKSENIIKSIYSWWIYEIDNLLNLTWDRYLIVIDRYNNIYLQWFTASPLEISIYQQAESESYNYTFSISSNYALTWENNIRKQLNTILGWDDFTYSFGGNNINIEYKPTPGKTYSGSIKFVDIFWQSINKNINIYHKELKLQYINTQIAWNTYNILPTKWSYSQFFVNYQNMPNRKYKISSCKINYETVKNMTWTIDNSRWYNVENYIYDCKLWKIYTGSFSHSSWFAYWKTYTAKIDIPSSLSGESYYRLEILSDSIVSGKQNSYNYENTSQKIAYFTKSNIWITAKSTSWATYLRPTYLDSAKFVTSGYIYTYDLANNYNSLNEKNRIIKYPLGKIPLIIPNDGYNTKIISLIDTNGDKSILVVWADANNSYYNWLNIESYINNYDLLDEKHRNWGYVTDMKIYGYTDRWLYKAWDDIFFNWFVRNKNNTNIPKWDVTITVSNSQWNIAFTSSWLKLDTFGGFKWVYHSPFSVALGDYFVSYQFGDITNSQNIKILEYQKPTFSAKIDYKLEWNNKYIISILPKYYFGMELMDYNIKTDVSISTQANNYRRNNDKHYYNQDSDTQNISSTSKSYSDFGKSGKYNIYFTWDTWWFASPVNASIYISTTITDNKSNEVHFEEKYIDIKPEVYIWLEWQYYDRSDISWYNANGILSWNTSLANDSLFYDIYYKDRNQNTYNWVDGEIYYSNNWQYKIISTGQKLDKPDNSFSIKIDMKKAWDYLLKVYVNDSNGKMISVNTKHINYYNRSDDQNMMWLLPNNYQMILSTDDKMHKFGDKVKLNLSPYIRWWKAIITVEKNDKILDYQTVELDWSDIYIPIRKWYEPNVNIYVNQIAGSDIDLGKRKEPKFFAGMTSIDVDPSSNILNLDIKTDKKEYKPWELVKMTIKTTDSDWKPVDARLSVAVVDKSLNDLYNYIKDPLEYFYRKTTSRVGNFTNMKLIYMSLKSFITWGSKWWWGSGPTSFGAIRTDLSDVAFWRSAIYSTWWVANFTFILPDNLTTRNTEVIWITKDTKLWVANQEFVVTKDLIVEPNLPLFLTLGDKIIVPTKVLLNPRNSIDDKQKVKIIAKLILSTGDEVILSNMEMPINKMALLPISIPYDIYETDKAQIYISAEYKWLSDAVINTIPIRKWWFELKNIYNQPLSKEGKINIDNVATKWKLDISISKMPSFDINNITRYLIHYPYWCTEQLSSALLPIMFARSVNPKLINKDIIDWDTVYINSWANNIYILTTETITKILKNQNPDGWFGYRWNDSSYYHLSAYVYGILSIASQNKLIKDIDVKSNISKLEKYLQNTNTTWGFETWSYIYYIYQKAMVWEKINQNTINTIKKIWDQKWWTLSAKVLLNYISIKNWGQIIYNINIKDFDQYWLDRYYSYNSFFDKYILASIQLRSLISAKSDKQAISDIYNYIIAWKWSDYDNLRWRSNQTNINVMMWLTDYADYILSNSKDINCNINIWTGKYISKLDKNNIEQKYSLTYDKQINTDISWTCDDDIIANISDIYIDPKPKQNKQKNIWVSNFYLDFDNSKKIWEIVSFTWWFVITKDANQLAVEYFIPSNIKLLYSIKTKNKAKDSSSDGYYWYYDQDLPFTYNTNGSYSRNCRPSHWEVRFDRLFLYYNRLSTGTSCQFDIEWIKAFDGVSNLQPSKIWEMYDSNIYWAYIKK